ncbi:MAG TPA: hypothetical protein VF806_00300 [Anaerolineaceae bacterium]
MNFGTTRSIKGDLILSPALPKAVIRYSSDFIYLGDLQYIARETHHVEEFIFLVPNSLGHITRLLLVHFEGFLENKEGEYEYFSEKSVKLGGEAFAYNLYFINVQDDLARFRGSDLAHAADYIRQRAYTLAGDMTYQRFQRLVSDDRRNLISISYMEANDDLTANAVAEDPQLGKALIERALKSFSLEPVEILAQIQE